MTITRDATGGPKEGSGHVQKVQHMQKQLQEKLQSTRQLARLARQVRMTDTPEGIRIDLVDDANFAMFQLGTTLLTSEAAELLRVIAETVGPEAGNLAIRGHTDSLAWRPGEPSNNWSLSAGRAEATRQELMRRGIGEDRYARIEGVAAREPLIQDNPADPRNRRISILLMN